MTAQSRTLEEVLLGLVQRVMAQLFVSRPATVERYDASLQQVDVRPLFREEYLDGDGSAAVEPPALVQNVPLVWTGASGGFLSFGLGVGDVVGLIYFDRSSDRWKSLGGEVDPIDKRRHAPSDAWAIPGLHAFNAPLSGVSTTDAVLSVRAGAQLLLGAPTASQHVATAEQVQTQLAALKTALSAAGALPPPADAAPITGASLAALLSSFLPTVASLGSQHVQVIP